MVAIVLPDNRLGSQLPEPGVVITTRRDEIRAVGTEGTVPHPPLMAIEFLLHMEGLVLNHTIRLVLIAIYAGWVREVDGPDARGVVGGTSGEVAHVGREQHSGDVGVVGAEFGHGHECRDVFGCDHAPDVDGAVYAIAYCCAEKGAVGCHSHGGDGFVFFRDQLM